MLQIVQTLVIHQAIRPSISAHIFSNVLDLIIVETDAINGETDATATYCVVCFPANL